MVMSIPLTKGRFALVDDDDYEHLSQFKWCCNNSAKIAYAVRGTKTKGRRINIKMHRFILGVSDSRIVVDHINHDGLDNRRQNLRLCTQADNMKNTRKRRGTSSTQKGVSFTPATGRWRAYIWVNKKRIHLGYFAFEESASAAYNEAAKEHFGEFAHLNTLEVPHVNGSDAAGSALANVPGDAAQLAK